MKYFYATVKGKVEVPSKVVAKIDMGAYKAFITCESNLGGFFPSRWVVTEMSTGRRIISYFKHQVKNRKAAIEQFKKDFSDKTEVVLSALNDALDNPNYDPSSRRLSRGLDGKLVIR